MQKFRRNSLPRLLKAKPNAQNVPFATASSEALKTAYVSKSLSIPRSTKGSSSSVVIRVRGLPSDRETAKALIQEVVTTNSTENTNFQISIIPSCVFLDETVALVDFECLPKFLSILETNPLDSWEISVHGSDLSFDKHFVGFTQLSSSEGEIRADVIALCGIDGHAYGSWQGRGNLRRMWLRHFLPEDLPFCRIISYGYNAKLARRDFASIEAYADEFIEALSAFRKREVHIKPMIFITHSFGGLILARSIIKAKQNDLEPMCSAIRGILFFAVPHRGVDISDMSKIMGSEQHPRHSLIEHIGINSLPLKTQLKDFIGMLRNTKIVSFYETEQSRRLIRDETGDWKRNGEYFTSLEASNAVLDLPRYIETQIPLHEDHSSIVKFRSKFDSGYLYASAHLQQIVGDLGTAWSLGNVSDSEL